MCEYILRKIQECATSNILIHMRQHVQNANAFQANAHKENASMYDTQYFGVYETTYANAFEEMQECTKPNILMHLRPHVQTHLRKIQTRKMQVCATPNL